MKRLSGNSFSPVAICSCLLCTLLASRAFSTPTPTCTPTPNLVCVEVAWEDFNDNDDWGPGPGHPRGWVQMDDSECTEEDLGGGNYYGVVRNKVSLILDSTGMESLTVNYRATTQGLSSGASYCYGLSVNYGGNWTSVGVCVSSNGEWSDRGFTYSIAGSDEVAVEFRLKPRYPWNSGWFGLDDIHITACYLDGTPTPTPTYTPGSSTPVPTCTPSSPLTCVEVAWEDFDDNDDWGPGPGHPTGWQEANDPSSTEEYLGSGDFCGLLNGTVSLFIDTTGMETLTLNFRASLENVGFFGNCARYGFFINRGGTWSSVEEQITEDSPWTDRTLHCSVAGSDQALLKFRTVGTHYLYPTRFLIDDIHLIACYSNATPTPTVPLDCRAVAWDDFNDNDDWGPGPGHPNGWLQTDHLDCTEVDAGGGNFYGHAKDTVSLLLDSTGMETVTVRFRCTVGGTTAEARVCARSGSTWTTHREKLKHTSAWSDKSFTCYVAGSDQVSIEFHGLLDLDDFLVTACYPNAATTPFPTPTPTSDPSLTCVDLIWEDFNDNDDWGPGPGHWDGWFQNEDDDCCEESAGGGDYYGVVRDEVNLLLDSTGMETLTISYRSTMQAGSTDAFCCGIAVNRGGAWTTDEDCISECSPWSQTTRTYGVAGSDQVAIVFRVQRNGHWLTTGLGLDDIRVTACYADSAPTPEPTPTPVGSPVPPCVHVFWDDFNDNDDWGPGPGHPDGWNQAPDEDCGESYMGAGDFRGVLRNHGWVSFAVDTRDMKTVTLVTTATAAVKTFLSSYCTYFGKNFLRDGSWPGVTAVNCSNTGFGYRDRSETYSVPEDADQVTLSFGFSSSYEEIYYALDNVGVIGCYGEDPLPWQDIGWIEVQSSAPMAASVLYENRSNEGVAGVPANVALSKNHCLCHLHSTDQYYTGVAVANPSGCDEAHVDLTAYDAAGGVLDSVSFVVPTKAKVSQLVSHPSLFGRRLGTGWMFLTSDVDVATTAMYGDRLSGGLAAAAGTEPLDTLVLPHFHCDRHWWTGLSVVNPNDVQVAIQATAYAENGRRLDVIQRTIPAKGRFEGLVDRLFKLPGDGKGWILVEATGGPVAGSVIYARRGAVPRSIAALSAVQPSADRHLLSFRDGEGWWTGVCAVNPSDTSMATAIWRARTSSGRLIDEVTIALAPRQKLLTLVGTLFDLSEISEGWVEMEADLPIACFGVLRADETGDGSKGLVAMESQPSALKLCIPHYDVRPVWQTHVLLGNPQDRSTRSVLWSYGNDGRLAGVVNPSISPKGRLCRHVRGLFRIPTPATRGAPLSQRRRCRPDGTLLGFREGASERAAPQKPRR